MLNQIPEPLMIALIVVGGIMILSIIASRFLTTVEAGTIRLVSWLKGATAIYRGPSKAWEVPVLTTATTIPSRAINIDIDVADQTCDMDDNGRPKPIKVRVLASAIVSVGDSNEMIKTAANKFFSKPAVEQNAILTDLLTSTGRRAINLLHHDELFNQRPTSGKPGIAAPVAETPISQIQEDEDRLAIIIKSQCSRELQDLGLVFNSLNIKEVQSEVAEARRRQSAVEAKANADIVTAEQERRAREAQLSAEQAINDKQRDLEQRRAENAAVVAQAEAKKQLALADQRTAELQATQIAKATADAEQVKIQAEAQADADAIKVRRVADAQAEAILKVNAAMSQGGASYIALKQLEMIPQIAPMIANALAQSKLISISGGEGGGPAEGTVNQVQSVMQTILAAQLVQGALKGDDMQGATPAPVAPAPPTPVKTPITPPKPVTPPPAPKPANDPKLSDEG